MDHCAPKEDYFAQSGWVEFAAETVEACAIPGPESGAPSRLSFLDGQKGQEKGSFGAKTREKRRKLTLTR